MGSDSGKKKKGKRIRHILLAVFAPILGFIFLIIIIIAAINHLFDMLSASMTALTNSIKQYAYELQGDVNDDVACRILRIQDADSIYDLCASDVAAAIRNAYTVEASETITNGLYSQDDLLAILDTAAEYELDDYLTGIYYNNTYRRTFTIDELFDIYVNAYETLCVEGKLLGGYDCIEALNDLAVDNDRTALSAISADGYNGVNYGVEEYDWVVEDKDGELYQALTKLDLIFYGDAEAEGGDSGYVSFWGLIKETDAESNFELIAPGASTSTSLSDVDLIYNTVNFPYSYSLNESFTNDDSERVYYMSLFVLEMESWFNDYGYLVNYDPVYEYIINEAGVDLTDESSAELYGLLTYSNDSFSGGSKTGVEFYDAYTSLPRDMQRSLWTARGYTVEEGESTVTNIGQSLTVAEYSLALHPYDNSLISYGNVDEINWPDTGTAGEEATVFTYLSDSELSSMDGYDYTYTQTVSVDMQQEYVNLSYYDVERELGVTWKLLLGLCAYHDITTSGLNEDGYLVLNTGFLEDCAEAIFAQELTCYDENNTIEAQEEALTELGLTTLEKRQKSPLSATQVQALTHTSTSLAPIYVGEGYYQTESSTPAYGTVTYTSLVADAETVLNGDGLELSDVTYHTSTLDAVLEDLGVSGGISNSFFQQLVAYIPGLYEELERIGMMEDGIYRVENCLLTETVYLSDLSTLSGSTLDESTHTVDVSAMSDYLISTWFYANNVTSADVIAYNEKYGTNLGTDVATTWFSDDEVLGIKSSDLPLMNLYATGQIARKLKDDGTGTIEPVRYRALTDEEIDKIMELTGLTEPTDPQDTKDMYTVILTALKSVGKIEYQNTPRAVSGDINWSNYDAMTAFIADLGYFPTDTYPRATSGNSNSAAYPFSADCTSFVAWLYNTAGNGTITWAASTSNYVSAAKSGDSVSGASYIGSEASANMNSWKVGDIVIMTSKGKGSGHAVIYIGKISDTTYATVECNGLQNADGYSNVTSLGYRGTVLYNSRTFDTGTYDYYVFRTSVSD